MNREIKQTRTSDSFNVRSLENEKPIIEGKFISFTDEYHFCSDAYETVSPALEIEGDDVRALVNHDTSLVLGRTTAGTLEIETRDDGVYGKIYINPDDVDAMNLYARVKRGDVSQCSFGFEILDEDTEILGGSIVHFTIKKISLYEVSVCTFPAYEDTGVTARAEDAEKVRQRGFDAWKARVNEKLKGESNND